MLNYLQSPLSVPLEIMDRIDQGIVLADAGGRVEYVNAAYSDLVGLDFESLIGLATEDVFSLAHRAKHKEQRQQREAGQSTTYESLLIGAGDSEIAVSITESPRWKDGRYDGFVMIVTRLPQCRLGQVALPDSEVSFAQIADSSLSGFVVHRGGEIIYVDPTALRQFGVAAARDMVGRSLIDFIAPSARAFAAAYIRPPAHAAASPTSGEMRGLRADGSIFDLE